LGITGEEVFTIRGIESGLKALGGLEVQATSTDGKVTRCKVRVRIDTDVELNYYRNGGILQAVLRRLALESKPLTE
jgi:aconitate hydratase